MLSAQFYSFGITDIDSSFALTGTKRGIHGMINLVNAAEHASIVISQ